MSPEMERAVRRAFEPELGRAMTAEEVEEYGMHMRRFAEFLIDCSKDKGLMKRLGLLPKKPNH